MSIPSVSPNRVRSSADTSESRPTGSNQTGTPISISGNETNETPATSTTSTPRAPAVNTSLANCTVASHRYGEASARTGLRGIETGCGTTATATPVTGTLNSAVSRTPP